MCLVGEMGRWELLSLLVGQDWKNPLFRLTDGERACEKPLTPESHVPGLLVISLCSLQGMHGLPSVVAWKWSEN